MSLKIVDQPPAIFYNDGPAKKFTVSIVWTGQNAIEYVHPIVQYSEEGKAVENQAILKGKKPWSRNHNHALTHLLCSARWASCT